MSVIQADNTSSGFFAGFNRRTEHLVSSTFNVPVIKNQILFVTAKPVTLRMNYGALFTTADLRKVIAAADGEISVSGYSVPAGTTAATIPDLSARNPVYKETYQITAESNLYSARIVHNIQDSAIEAGTFVFVVEIKNYIHIPPQLKSERLIVIDSFYINGATRTDTEAYYSEMLTQLGSIGKKVNEDIITAIDAVKTEVGSVKTAVGAMNESVNTAVGSVRAAVEAVDESIIITEMRIRNIKIACDTMNEIGTANSVKLDTLHNDLAGL
jgi:hypothetical protein